MLLLNKFESLYEGAQEIGYEIFAHIQKLIKENNVKISAISMSAKMILIGTLFAIIPADTQGFAAQSYKTAIKLDITKPLPVLSNSRQVAINTGVSNLDNKSMSGTRGQIASAQYFNEPEGIENYIDLYKAAGAQYGVPWEILAAVHYVESGASGSTNRTSYAGAQGPMQFMPGTWRAYGVDANGDGVADAHNVSDAIYGAANLLAAGGAAEGNIDAALFNYNHAQWYVNKVKNIAAGIQ
jgi:hypothetical protein